MISSLPAQQKLHPRQNILYRQTRSFMFSLCERLPWSTSDSRFGKQISPVPAFCLGSRFNRHFSKDEEGQ